MQLTDVFIMSKAWAHAHGAEVTGALKPGPESPITTKAIGTGPFVLVSRRPENETVMRRNPNYWELLPDITELVYRVIPDKAARVAGLLEGKIDFVQDVPVEHLAELAKHPDVLLKSGPENRVIILGTNVTPHLRTATGEQTPNPLADRNVRYAIDIAIDRRAIQREVMNGQSIPTGVPAPPTINGYPQRFDHVRPPDRDRARELLKQAGYPEGFALPLDCPNDRYVNDALICEALAKQLSEIGIKLTPRLRSKSEHFPLIRSNKSDFYLFGWGVPTFDSEYVFRHLFRSGLPGQPSWNGTGFSEPAIDELIDSIANEINLMKRNQTIADVWWRVHAERIYIPIHVQTLTYAMRKGLDIDVDISDTPKLKYLRLGQPTQTSPY